MHVFISYSSKDIGFVFQLIQKLEAENFTVWYDKEGIEGARLWREEIDKALQDAFVIVLVVSPNSNKSQYVQYEWAFARGADKAVIQVLHKTPGLIYQLESFFYPFLKTHPRLEQEQNYDLRNGSNEREWQKLIEKLKKEELEYGIRFKAPPTTSSDIRELFNDLNSVYWTARKHAALTLGQKQFRPAQDALIQLMQQDEHEDVRSASAQALGDLRSNFAIPSLTHALFSDQGQWVRVTAANALGQIGNPSATNALISALKNENETYNVRAAAATALGNIRNRESVPSLIAVLDYRVNIDADKARMVSDAIQALGKLGGTEVVNALGEFADTQAKLKGIALETLIDMQEPSKADAIIRYLNDQSWYICSNAIVALGKLQAAQAVPYLVTKLSDVQRKNVPEGKSISEYAIEALEKIGTPEALAAIAAWQIQKQ